MTHNQIDEAKTACTEIDAALAVHQTLRDPNAAGRNATATLLPLLRSYRPLLHEIHPAVVAATVAAARTAVQPYNVAVGGAERLVEDFDVIKTLRDVRGSMDNRLAESAAIEWAASTARTMLDVFRRAAALPADAES